MQNSQAENSPATKLLQTILAKVGLEFLVILAALTWAAYSHINPPIRGAIDFAAATRITGWAYDPREPDAQFSVQLFLDGKFIATTQAKEPRADLLTAGAAQTPNHGFIFAVPALPAGKYKINVYAVRAGGGQNQSLLTLTKKDQYLEIR